MAMARRWLWRATLLAGLLLGCAALLFAWRPAPDPGAESNVASLLRAVEKMALVVGTSSSDEVAPFFLDRFEVTNAEYEVFRRATGHHAPGGGAPDPKDVERLPVVFVSAADAKAYAAYRGKRLPTDLEWLAAASIDTSFASGQVSRYAVNLLETGLDGPARVGTFENGPTSRLENDKVSPPCYDLIGNVAEWAEPTSGSTPIGEFPVLGGSFRDSSSSFGQFGTASTAPQDRTSWIGFRCALGDADGWLDRLLRQLAELRPETAARFHEPLRRFDGALERLLRSRRFREAFDSMVPNAVPTASNWKFVALGGGRALAIADETTEIVDVVGGVVSSTTVPIAVRHGETREDRIGNRIYLPGLERGAPSSGDRLALGFRLDGHVEVLATGDREPMRLLDSKGIPRLLLPGSSLPECVASAIWSMSPVACPGSEQRTNPLEITVTEKGIEARATGFVAVEGDVAANPPCDVVYVVGPASPQYLQWNYSRDLESYLVEVELLLPEVDRATGNLAVLVALAAENGVSRGSWLLPMPWVAGVAVPAHGRDRIVVFGGNQLAIVDDLGSGAPRLVSTQELSDGALEFRTGSHRLNGSTILEANSELATLQLMRLDASGRVDRTMRITTPDGVRSFETRALGDVLLVLDSAGAMHCVESDLTERWVTPVSYSFDSCDPVIVDYDGDGDAEIAIQISGDTVAFVDLATGHEDDRVITTGTNLQVLIAGAFSDAATSTLPHGVTIGMTDAGFYRLRAPATRTDAVARELLGVFARTKREGPP